CRFGCNAVEDAHHLFVDCPRYWEWKDQEARKLIETTKEKCREEGVEEAAVERHIPPLEKALPSNAIRDILARERFLHHMAATWHLVAIRMAGRIFGDYQREMAKRNVPLRKRGKA
ncbi:hypothetical protein GGX14DRAFT_379053, partial [Mycena pura]